MHHIFIHSFIFHRRWVPKYGPKYPQQHKQFKVPASHTGKQILITIFAEIFQAF